MKKKAKKRFDAFKEEREETEAMIASFQTSKKKKLPTANCQLPTKAKALAPSDSATAAQLMDQYRIVVAAEAASFRERVKFGAMLIMWERYLGEGRGAGKDGDGLKGWLEDNCPAISYKAAMNYKYSAQRAIAMLGGGAMATAALLGESEVTQPDGEVVDVAAEVVEKRDALFEDATSRRKLEQMYFDFMKKEDAKAKRKAGAGNGEAIPRPTRAEAAARIWAAIMAQLDKASALDSIALLAPKIAATCYERLQQLTAAMKEQMKVRA